MILDPLNLSIIAGSIIFVLANIALANSLVAEKYSIRKSWQTIVNAFNTRTDLIPLLIETFKEYKRFDKKSLQKLIKYKNDSYKIKQVEKKFEIEEKIDEFISQIFKEGEKSNKLSKDIDFLELGNLFSEKKSEIQNLIQIHNDLTDNYNENLKSFYSILIRPMLGWRGIKKVPSI